MQPVEPLVEVGEAVRAHVLGVDRNRDLVPLSAVAHVGRERDGARLGGDPLVVEPGDRAPAELVEDLADLSRIRVGEHTDVRAGELVAEVGDEVADRAEKTRRGRDEHREGAHDLRDRVRVKRAGAPVGDEREVAWIVAALDGDEPQRTGHVLVDDREDALGGRLDRGEAHGVGDRLHGRAGRLDVELHLAAEQARRQVAERRRSRRSPSAARRPCRRRQDPGRPRPTAGRHEAPSSAPARGRSSRRPAPTVFTLTDGTLIRKWLIESRGRSSAGRSGRAPRRWTCRPCRT